MKKYICIISIALVIAGLSMIAAQKNPQETLKMCVEQRAQAVVSGKWDVVYTYFDSEYRNFEPKEKFVHKNRNVKIKEYRIESLQIQPSGKEAEAKLKLAIEFQGYTFKDAPQKQQWIKQAGDWYLKEKTQKTNPFSSAVPAKPAQKK